LQQCLFSSILFSEDRRIQVDNGKFLKESNEIGRSMIFASDQVRTSMQDMYGIQEAFNIMNNAAILHLSAVFTQHVCAATKDTEKQGEVSKFVQKRLLEVLKDTVMKYVPADQCPKIVIQDL